VLERYVMLLEKNDPATGGSLYLQSKVISAKEFLMEGVRNSLELEEEFFRDRKKEEDEKKEAEEGDKKEEGEAKEPQSKKEGESKK
jgi:hypothetical protein